MVTAILQELKAKARLIWTTQKTAVIVSAVVGLTLGFILGKAL